MKIKIVLLMALVFSQFCLTQVDSSHESFRIFPSPVTQTEPSVAVSPVSPLIMFASAVTINTGNGFRSEGVYVSTDGGQNWSGTDTCKGALIMNHGGDPGVAVDSTGRFILTHIGSVFTGVYSHYSTDLGTNWSNAYTITNQQPEDKGTTTIDNSRSSPFYGRIYTAWVNFVSPFPVVVSYSTSGGSTWTQAAVINKSPPARCSGGSIRTGRDGKVYACWSGVTSASPFNEDFAGFASSSDGGVTWTVSENIFDMNGIAGTLPEKNNIRVNGLPEIDVDNSGGLRDGWIYIVTAEKNISPAGSDPDIIFHRSTDGGQIWSSGIRVNQDSLNNGNIQYFPTMAVDSNGGINIIYYDDRNTSSDSAEVFLARSADGGNLWSEVPISGHRFQPKSIFGGSSNYQGDHISIVTAGNKIHAFWMDDFSGLYQIWTAAMDLDVNYAANAPDNLPQNFELSQNYPNPFNPSTSIIYSIPEQSLVRITVHNVLGQVVQTLADQVLPPGRYQAVWKPANSSSGFYFCKMTAIPYGGGAFHDVRKMMFLK